MSYYVLLTLCILFYNCNAMQQSKGQLKKKFQDLSDVQKEEQLALIRAGGVLLYEQCINYRSCNNHPDIPSSPREKYLYKPDFRPFDPDETR